MIRIAIVEDEAEVCEQLVGYLRRHPDADDEMLADLIAQTLHLDR